MDGLRATRLLLVLLAALLAGGCGLRADVEVRLDRRGGGTVTVGLAADESLDAEARQRGLDLVAAVEDAAGDLEGWDVRADGRRVELSTEVDGPDDLRRTTAAFADSLAGPELRPLDPVVATVEDGRLVVETVARLTPTDEVAALGWDPDEATALLDGAVTYTVVIEMPGDVVAHNAHRSHGNRLLWEVAAGEEVAVRAEAEVPRGFPVAAVVAVVAVVAVALFVAVGRARRGRADRSLPLYR